jgi:hypothetical protein
MPIGVLHDLPGATRETYESIVRELTGGPMESLSDWPVDGVLCHIAGPTDGGWRVVDVWESEESFRSFGQKLVPAMEAAGVTSPPPQTFPVHNFVK